MGTLIGKTTHNHYRKLFFDKVKSTPYSIELEVSSVTNSGSDDFLSGFVGDSTRTSVSHTFKALYEKEISDRTREKYGLPKEVNGVVYLSPLQLVPVYGTFKLNWNKVKVHFEDRVQVINKIVYLEQLFDSCVGVQIFVQDELKGG